MSSVILAENDKAKLCQLQIEMLDEIVSICDRHNLKYFLVGGTCLGAVRHNGFIPWDDDIDIALPRDDYEKFAQICVAELNSKYFYQDHKTESQYPLNFAKLRRNNTTFVEGGYKDLKIHHGVYLDIFPLDGMSNDMKVAKKHISNVHRARGRCLGLLFLDIKEFKNRSFKSKIKYFIGKVYKKFLGMKNAWKKVDKLMTKYSLKESSIIGNIGGAWGIKEVMPKAIMLGNDGEETFMQFEGKEYRVPYDYDAYLKCLYGDYMTPPPEYKRVSHHGIIDINFECGQSNKEN